MRDQFEPKSDFIQAQKFRILEKYKRRKRTYFIQLKGQKDVSRGNKNHLGMTFQHIIMTTTTIFIKFGAIRYYLSFIEFKLIS